MISRHSPFFAGLSRSGSTYRNGEGQVVLTAIGELKDTVLDTSNRIIEGLRELKEELGMKGLKELMEELALKEVKEELAMKELKEVKEELAMMKARDKGAAASDQQTQVQNDGVTSPVLNKSSLFVAAGRRMGSSRSGSSYRNDDNRYVDDNLVEKLQRTRNSVMQLMNKVEEKQFTEPDIKNWLVSIKHTMYDANALLDNIDMEVRFREKYMEDGFPSYSISGFVQSAISEINRIIEELKEELAMMKARDEGAAAFDKDTSPVLGTIVYGREEEKAQILEKVLHLPEHFAPKNKPEVIAIVGMVGLGKTTLAQYLYNHDDVVSCFWRRSWACVSDNFDLVRVTQAILESLTQSSVGVRGLASLQQQLEEQLRGRRFLVVLDDVRDSSWQNWEKLMAPFSTGATGSKIIVTTRDTLVADVAPADHSFQLEPMSEDELWSLFSCEVFRDGELSQHPKLEAIGKEIVKKCGGSPLVIKIILRGILRSERNEVEWERVLESMCEAI